MPPGDASYSPGIATPDFSTIPSHGTVYPRMNPNTNSFGGGWPGYYGHHGVQHQHHYYNSHPDMSMLHHTTPGDTSRERYTMTRGMTGNGVMTSSGMDAGGVEPSRMQNSRVNRPINKAG